MIYVFVCYCGVAWLTLGISRIGKLSFTRWWSCCCTFWYRMCFLIYDAFNAYFHIGWSLRNILMQLARIMQMLQSTSHVFITHKQISTALFKICGIFIDLIFISPDTILHIYQSCVFCKIFINSSGKSISETKIYGCLMF